MKNLSKIPLKLINSFIVIWLVLVSFLFFLYHPLDLYRILDLFNIYGSFSFSSFLLLIPDYIISVILLAGTVLSAFFIGKQFIKNLKFDSIHLCEEVFFSLGTGFGFLAYIIFFLGSTGLIYKAVFFLFWILLSVMGMLEIVRTFRERRVKLNIKLNFNFFIFLLAALILFNFLMSFTPEMFYDSLNYHLGVPNYYKINNRILPMPFKPHSNFPLIISMLYLWAIVLKSTALAKLINFTFGVLTALGIIYFSKNHFKSIRAGLFAGIAFYFTPVVMSKSWVTAAEMGLAFFIFLSLWAMVTFLKNNNDKWLFLSAITAGFALGIKYTALFFVFGILVLIISSGKIKKAFLWAGIVLIVFSPWLIRNYTQTRNPVHPMFAGIFESKYPFKVVSFQRFSSPNIRSFREIIKIPWTYSIKGGGTEDLAFPEYYMIGAVFLSLLPSSIFFLWYFRREKFILKFLAVFTVSSYAAAALFVKEAYFYIPCFTALSIFAGYIIEKYYSQVKIFGGFAPFIFLCLNIWNFLYMLQFAQNDYKPLSLLTGSIPKNEYINLFPAHKVFEYVNKKLPQNSKLLIFGDAKCYYLERNFISGSVMGLNPIMEYLENAGNSRDFLNKLKEEGVSHIIVNVNEALRTKNYGYLYYSETAQSRLQEFWNKHISEIYNYKGVFLYKIEYEKKSEKPPVNTIRKIYSAL